MKDKFVFTTISENLTRQVCDLLEKKGFSPKVYVQHRFGRNDCRYVRLTKKESSDVKHKLNDLLKILGTKYTIDSLKRY